MFVISALQYNIVNTFYLFILILNRLRLGKIEFRLSITIIHYTLRNFYPRNNYDLYIVDCRYRPWRL